MQVVPPGATEVSFQSFDRCVDNVFRKSMSFPLSNVGHTLVNRLTKSCSIFRSLRCLSGVSLNLLKRTVGESYVSIHEGVRQQHSHDEGFHEPVLPDVVVYPGCVEEVQEVTRLCYKERIPVIPYGTGTGLEGGVIPVQGGLSMDLHRMSSIESVHNDDFNCTVEPGVTRHSLNTSLRDTGLWFPIDPGADASLCGMCATSASGTNAVRYGTMRENVLNLEVVLSDGRVVNTAGAGRRSSKTSAGYNLTNLFVGSEGTLGIITKATLRLYGTPEAVISGVCHFPTIQNAVNTCVNMLQAGIPVARLEYMDELSMKVVNEALHTSYQELPSLFLEFHGSHSSVDEDVQMAGEIVDSNGGLGLDVAKDEKERNDLWKARHNIYWLCKNQKPNSAGCPTDVCVPISKLPQVLVKASQHVKEKGIWAPILGHVGDGNFHVGFFVDKNDESEVKIVKSLADQIAQDALAVGGTCTGEHGIGLGKRHLLVQEFGETDISVMKQIKTLLDPKNIMNPGKVLL